ncbi:Protein of unknown function [Bacillus wiedmannii]|nr:Protein of unknown function [Bacillus wiedmannii]
MNYTNLLEKVKDSHFQIPYEVIAKNVGFVERIGRN